MCSHKPGEREKSKGVETKTQLDNQRLGPGLRAGVAALECLVVGLECMQVTERKWMSQVAKKTNKKNSIFKVLIGSVWTDAAICSERKTRPGLLYPACPQ